MNSHRDSPKPVPRRNLFLLNLNNTSYEETFSTNSSASSSCQSATASDESFCTKTMPTPRKPRRAILIQNANANATNTTFLLNETTTQTALDFDMERLRADYSFDKFHIDMSDMIMMTSTLMRPNAPPPPPPPPLPKQPPPPLLTSTPYNNLRRQAYLNTTRNREGQEISKETTHATTLLGFDRLSKISSYSIEKTCTTTKLKSKQKQNTT